MDRYVVKVHFQGFKIGSDFLWIQIIETRRRIASDKVRVRWDSKVPV